MAIKPSAIYVWLVPSEEVLEQPGSWRIRKWDTEPFPEANYTLMQSETASRNAAPQEGAGPPAGPAANGEPAVAASFANELERLPTTVSGSGVALVFFALHPEKRDELVRAIRSLEDAHYRAWHLEAEVNGIREAARAPSAAVCSACGAKEGEPCRGNLRIADLQRYSEGITMKFASHCPDGQMCGATTTGCLEGQCQRKDAEFCTCRNWCPVHGQRA
jgi:hypothetical protein